jgi:hypothetical protein
VERSGQLYPLPLYSQTAPSPCPLYRWLGLDIAKKKIFLVSTSNGTGSRDSAVGMEAGYELDDRGVRVLVPVRARIFFRHVVQTCCTANPASYPMGTGDCFPGVKRPEREADHTTPTSVEVKKT